MGHFSLVFNDAFQIKTIIHANTFYFGRFKSPMFIDCYEHRLHDVEESLRSKRRDVICMFTRCE